MSIQDKLEHILKSIHLLFSQSPPYGESGDKIIVDKQAVFSLLEKLNLAVYEAMDQYEVTAQKQDISKRRCEKHGEEIIQKASKHADDIYAASIMYTDDAINRICYIMDDASQAIQNMLRKMSVEMEEQRERVKRNQLELTGQLRDFADTDKYVKLIQEVNRQLEKEHRQQTEGKKEKRIPNEGKSYSAIKPDIKVNQAYFERTGTAYPMEDGDSDNKEDANESLARVTGKEFAENLRRRAAKSRAKELEVQDMSTVAAKENISREDKNEKEIEDILSKAGAGLAALVEKELKEMRSASKAEDGSKAAESQMEPEPYTAQKGFAEEGAYGAQGDFAEEGPALASITPEIRVDLDAEYFKWKEGQQGAAEEKKERHFLFGRKQ